MSKKYTIQQVTEKTKLSVHTLRYYEQIGLIPPIERAANGHRCYSESNLQWIRCIQSLRISKVSISDIQKFIKLSRQCHSTNKELLKLVERHEQKLLNQIQEIQKARLFLRDQINSYHKQKETVDPLSSK